MPPPAIRARTPPCRGDGVTTEVLSREEISAVAFHWTKATKLQQRGPLRSPGTQRLLATIGPTTRSAIKETITDSPSC